MGLVKFYGDGRDLSPAEMVRALAGLRGRGALTADRYGEKGTVARLEHALAGRLGKPAAMFVPTGTLANLLAVRALCAGRRRLVAVQRDSHLYNDSGDGAAALAGLTLLPLGGERPGFTAADLEAAARHAGSGKVPFELGAVALECPVRARHGRASSFRELARISALSRRLGAGVHLDGARLFLASAASGVPVRRYAALADTVYVSLYKYFDAPSGAVLAGPRGLIEGLRRERRVFGGTLPEATLTAALALKGLSGFEGRFKTALTAGRRLFAALRRLPGLRLETFPDGTNIALLRLRRARPAAFSARLKRSGVLLGRFDASLEAFHLQVNETILGKTAAELAAVFRKAAR